MSQMAEGEGDDYFDPMAMDEYEDGQLDGTAGPSYHPSNYMREGSSHHGHHGGFDEGFFPSPTHPQHHKGSTHHRQNQQGDKTVDSDFFNGNK
ncbi:10860_t:CDS:2 [Funneliformis mosseae]|uniref:10860_t:CDS:1 n=1 Tax=Funneliformis mosseae TaxID=27381 RepID=A0A9N8ZDM3_FUNMO|nr:10860_t:CDS:2 [Funneliformis mosseae]